MISKDSFTNLFPATCFPEEDVVYCKRLPIGSYGVTEYGTIFQLPIKLRTEYGHTVIDESSTIFPFLYQNELRVILRVKNTPFLFKVANLIFATFYDISLNAALNEIGYRDNNIYNLHISNLYLKDENI